MHTFYLPTLDHFPFYSSYIYFCCLLVFTQATKIFIYKVQTLFYLTSVIITLVSDSEFCTLTASLQMVITGGSSMLDISRNQCDYSLMVQQDSWLKLKLIWVN